MRMRGTTAAGDTDLEAALLARVAARAATPEGRREVARSLRAALRLVEASGPPSGQRKALEELAFSLGMAAEHAQALVEHGQVTG